MATPTDGPMIDMQAIREALNRRLSGQAPGPLLDQMSQPGQPSPLGTRTTPTDQPPSTPAPTPQTLGPTPAPTTQGGQPKAKPNFDDETKAIGKALITKLLQVI